MQEMDAESVNLEMPDDESLIKIDESRDDISIASDIIMNSDQVCDSDSDIFLDTSSVGSNAAAENIFVLESSESESDYSGDDVIIEKVRRRRKSKRQKRTQNTDIRDTLMIELRLRGVILKPQSNVELRPQSVLSDGKILGQGYFMRIKRILNRTETYKDGTEMIQKWAQGFLFRRHRELDGILPKTAGEIALMREHAEVRVCDIVNIREIIMTNQLGRQTFRKSYNDAKDDCYGRLICRWKARIKDNIDGKTGIQQLGATGYIRRLTEAEADPLYRVSDRELSRSWRFGSEIGANGTETSTNKEDINDTNGHMSTIQDVNGEANGAGGGSTVINTKASEPVGRSNKTIIDLCTSENCQSSTQALKEDSVLSTDSEAHPKNEIVIIPDTENTIGHQAEDQESKKRKRWYTFGDAFCGAGGATRGATAKGFKVRYGIDHDENAIEAWRSNFGRMLGYHEDVHKFFAENPRSTTYVDLLHLSPPCQFFSWARTVAGKNDDKNEASFFCIPNTLKSCHPRAVTVEETDGLVGLGRTVCYFKCLLGDFTASEYSVKYAVLNSALYGVPSRRKRLVMIACCPGETLPNFPRPTHFYSSDPMEPKPVGLKNAVTLRKALRKIPPYATDHDIQLLDTVAPSSLRLPPHEWDEPFRSTIKCAGGEYNLHPDRNRKFTLRELAVLQSFPIHHQFCGTKSDKMRQVGNAFPPKLVGAVMRSVKEHLEKTDEEREGGSKIL